MITWRERRTTSEPKEIERRILQLSKSAGREVTTFSYSLAHIIIILFRVNLNAMVILSHGPFMCPTIDDHMAQTADYLRTERDQEIHFTAL